LFKESRLFAKNNIVGY